MDSKRIGQKDIRNQSVAIENPLIYSNSWENFTNENVVKEQGKSNFQLMLPEPINLNDSFSNKDDSTEQSGGNQPCGSANDQQQSANGNYQRIQGIQQRRYQGNEQPIHFNILPSAAVRKTQQSTNDCIKMVFRGFNQFWRQLINSNVLTDQMALSLKKIMKKMTKKYTFSELRRQGDGQKPRLKTGRRSKNIIKPKRDILNDDDRQAQRLNNLSPLYRQLWARYLNNSQQLARLQRIMKKRSQRTNKKDGFARTQKGILQGLKTLNIEDDIPCRRLTHRNRRPTNRSQSTQRDTSDNTQITPIANSPLIDSFPNHNNFLNMLNSQTIYLNNTNAINSNNTVPYSENQTVNESNNDNNLINGPQTEGIYQDQSQQIIKQSDLMQIKGVHLKFNNEYSNSPYQQPAQTPLSTNTYQQFCMQEYNNWSLLNQDSLYI